MAKKKPTSRTKRVMDQVKEPFALLETLKSEGLANATLVLGMASEAAKNFRLEQLKPQLKEMMHSVGFVTKSYVERLEERIDELEGRVADLETEAGPRDEDE